MMLTNMTYQQKMTKSKRILKDYQSICRHYKSWKQEVHDAQEMLRFLLDSKGEWFEMRQLKSTQYNRTTFESNSHFSKIESVQQQYISMVQTQKKQFGHCVIRLSKLRHFCNTCKWQSILCPKMKARLCENIIAKIFLWHKSIRNPIL